MSSYHVLSFQEYLTEATKAYVSPDVQFAMSMNSVRQKVNDLKKSMIEAPEQRDFIMAKIQVELEKIDVIQAKKNLADAKEQETKRKEMEKARKAMEKARDARK